MTDKSGKPATTVQSFIDALDHPLKSEIAALRKLLLSADPAISEEIKWNAPSFRTSEHFATMHLRARNAVQLILHLGAKPKRTVPPEAIADPEGLLKWLGADRASVGFAGTTDLAHKSDALVAIIRQWIKHV
ncbi:hypothetical protein CSC74_15490 [Pseudoxanthomonas yeongjuensis]|jgi:hypothetical protein|uniref:DUF1801 domain-containing protein n=1 Tax=Pseudoxanthomonas yeongjuensis TaxID=377616 RepID=UPI001390E683|nr:DUF1801 domain-containing protein [Pseudoxanthomonas yeongjuensis]KAF1714652.1 hypothetical protein CSC74_15490 [Pseudoxanthomonas yeongjuensis]